MHSLLGPAHYIADEIFSREQERLFGKLWIFAGLRSLVEARDSFLTHTIGGVPIVIQNGGGTLRAFVNQCAHRLSPVQAGDYGCRRLACPYHGWVYDDNGRVKSIPGRDALYGFPDATFAERKLKPVALASVGNLLFVNLDHDPPALEEQFRPEFLRRIEEVSSFMDDEAIFAKFRGRYNWKLNFENVNDYNHVPYVHTRSFAPLLSRLPVAQNDARSEARAAAPIADDAIDADLRELSYETQAPFEFRHWPWHDWIERFGAPDTYYNFFIYPNVNFITMAGAIYLVQQFDPIAPGETEVSLTMTMGRKRRKIPASPAILWGHLKAEKEVINEDIAVLEGLQRAMSERSPAAFHGSYEIRLRRMAKVYRGLIDRAAA